MQRLIDKKKEKTREEIVKCVNGERYTKTKRVKENENCVKKARIKKWRSKKWRSKKWRSK